MLSRSVKQRLGSLIREEARARSGARVAATGRALRAKATDREIVPAGIDEILPGGVIAGREGSIFVHERLYTELREKPAPLLKKLNALASATAGGTKRRRARDLPEAVAEATGAP